MEKKLEELKEYLLQEINSKNFSFEDAHGNCGVFTSDIIGNQALSMSYKYFDVVTNEKYYDDNLNELKKVIIKDKIARDTVISYLKDGLNEHFWEVVMMIEEAFAKRNIDYKKFRGDLAEAIFVYVKCAEKNLDDNQSTDVKYNGETVEIKSISEGSREITISKQQSENKVDTYAVSIVNGKHEDGAMNIIEIAMSLEGNASFKKYLLETYSNSELGSLFHYVVNAKVIKNITRIVNNSINNKHMIKATFRIPE